MTGPHYGTTFPAMILYHTTRVETLPAIDRQGLLPHLPGIVHQGEHVNLTNGKPVVWLTSTPNEWTTANGGGSARITVRLEPNSARLAHYMTWVRKQAPGLRDVLMAASQEQPDYAAMVENWFVYFGTVPRNRLVLPPADACPAPHHAAA